MFGRAKQKLAEKIGTATKTEEGPEVHNARQHLKETENTFAVLRKFSKIVYSLDLKGRPDPVKAFSTNFVKPSVEMERQYENSRIDMDATCVALLKVKPAKFDAARATYEAQVLKYDSAKLAFITVTGGLTKKRADLFHSSINEMCDILRSTRPLWPDAKEPDDTDTAESEKLTSKAKNSVSSKQLSSKAKKTSVIPPLSADVLHAGSLLRFTECEGKRFFKKKEPWEPVYGVVVNGALTFYNSSDMLEPIARINLKKAVLSSSSTTHVDRPTAFSIEEFDVPNSHELDVANEALKEGFLQALTSAMPNKIFSVPLATAAKRSDRQQLVPAPLSVATAWLNKHALAEEGLYRIPGSKAEVEKWIRKFDRGEEVVIPQKYFGANMASFIVQFIRRCPGSLFSDQYAPVFEQIAEDEEKSLEQQVGMVKKLVQELIPAPNRETLKVLCHHLRQVSLNSEVNQMTATKLAMCVYSVSAQAMQLLIDNYCEVFNEPQGGLSEPSSPAPAYHSDSDDSNSSDDDDFVPTPSLATMPPPPGFEDSESIAFTAPNSPLLSSDDDSDEEAMPPPPAPVNE